MKICNITQLKDFIGAVNRCRGIVWLESPEGDKYNLKSQFSQYVALGALLSERGRELELFCANQEDEQNFFAYFGDHPEVNA